MSIKISELPQATSVSSNDIVPIVQGGTTKRATKEMMFPTIASTIDSTSTNSEVAGAKAVFDFADTTPTDISNLITYTAISGVTISRFAGTKVGNILFLEVAFSYASTTNKVIDILTLTNVTNLVTTYGNGRTYDAPASTTVLPCSSGISGTSYKITIYASGTSKGGLCSFALPMPTITSASTNLSNTLLRNTNTILESEELEEKEPIEEVKQEETKEPILEEIVQEETNAEGSGDVR